MSRVSDLAASETTASSARSARSEVSRAAVCARIMAIPSRRLSCSARCLSLLVSSARTRARSSRTRRATTWNFVRTEGSHATALGGRLDLPHGAGEHRDDALVVAIAGPSLGSRGAYGERPIGAGHVEPQTPPSSARRARRGGIDLPVRGPAVGAVDVGTELAQVATPRRDSVPPICERSTCQGPTARPRWNPATTSMAESPTTCRTAVARPAPLPGDGAPPTIPARRAPRSPSGPAADPADRWSGPIRGQTRRPRSHDTGQVARARSPSRLRCPRPDRRRRT